MWYNDCMIDIREEISNIFTSPIDDKQSVIEFLREKEAEGQFDQKRLVDILFMLCKAFEEGDHGRIKS